MTKQSKSYKIDMCNGPILSKMLLFAIPLVFSGILQLLFNAADVVVVGRFAGENALAAVGSTSSLVNLFINVFMGLSIGVNVLVGRYFGEKQDKHLKETVHTAVAVSLVSGIALAVLGALLSPLLLQWMDSPTEVLPLATVYLRVYFLGMPASMLYNFCAAVLRSVGDTKRPLYYLSIAGVINVTLNLIFVIVFQWSVFGVALATIISQCVSAYLVLRCLIKEQGALHLELKELKIHKDKIKKIMQIGIPAGINSVVFSVSNVLIQSSVNSFGAITVAGNSAASNIEGFVYVSMNAIYQASISFTSQNVGARKYKRLDRILWVGQGCVTVVGIVLSSLVRIFGTDLLGLYTNNTDVIAAGMVRLGIICSTYFLCGNMEVFVGLLRGMGYSVAPMIEALLGSCALRVVWLLTVFPLEQFHKIETVYIVYPISWVITIIAHWITYLIVKRKFIEK
jgi:putative MATE family efflux protein